MPLHEFVKEELVSCSEQNPIADVIDLMKKRDVGAVVIVKDGRPVGIVTDRDIVVRAIAEHMDVKQPTSQIMTKSVASVSQNMSLQEVIAKMRQHQVRRIPVVDDEGKAIGLLSFGDIFGLLAQEIAELSRNTPIQAA
jgi:CBS domain-containing protein